MGMTIGKIIIPLLKATTTIQSIFFFEFYAKIIKNAFTKHYQKQLKNSEIELKQNLEEIRKSKKNNAKNLYQVMKLNLENLGSIQLGVTTKNFDKFFKKINSDALNIMFEIRDSSKYADSKIFKALGRIASPPYIGYNYVRDNIVIKLNLALEENIEYDSCILDFLEGFTTESLKSPYIEGIMAYELESILDIIQKIGHSRIKTKKQSYLYYKAFRFYLKISKIITELIKNQRYNPGNPLQRMIERIGRIESSFLTSNRVLLDVQLYRIKELIKLDIPLQLKLILFKMLKEVINRIERVDLSGPNIFSIFQEIFSSILKPQLLDNLNYDQSKIKKNDIRIDNKHMVYTKNGIIYGVKYNITLLRWLNETIEYLFQLYIQYIQRLDEKKIKTLSHHFIENLNRIFIDLVVYLYTLKPTSNFDANFFIEENVIRLINKLIELGDKTQKNKDTIFDLSYLLAPSLVISDYIIQNNPDSEVLKIIKKKKNDFTLLIKVGLNLISRSRIKEDIFPLKKKKINEKKELIEISFLDKYEMPIEHFKAKRFLMQSIETRPGSWKVVGHQIGYYIGNLSSILSNEQEILKFISNSV